MTESDSTGAWPAGAEVTWSHRGAGFAYVPGRLLVSGPTAGDRASGLLERAGRSLLAGPEPLDPEGQEPTWLRLRTEGPVLDVVDELRADGFAVQPEHVLFAHAGPPGWGGGCCCCGDGPGGGPGGGLAGNPLRANPLRANPLRANPLRANPLRANPLRANHPLDSTARPADAPALAPGKPVAPDGQGPRVLVLDSGVVDAVQGAAAPPLLAGALGGRITGDPDQPDTVPDVRGDGWLDPVAGHGTFIAGLLEQLAPGCTIEVRRVMDPLGRVLEGELRRLLLEAALGRWDLVSLSFGGQVMGSTGVLQAAVARLRRSGAVVVASAGNDGTWVPQVPASLPGVVAVAALDGDGPAEFTNYGDWVDACAPGVDLVSAFFDGFDGPNPEVNGMDLDRFTGWARWSGTSFAAPVVVAALAREMGTRGIGPQEALRRVVESDHLLRLPWLGTVVNL